MTKAGLLKALENTPDDEIIVVQGREGGWDNIEEVKQQGGTTAIIFGGGSPFSDE